jgi:hypothetical protein
LSGEYAADPRYEWTAVCERLSGTHPAQVCLEWNTAVPAAEYEGEPGRRVSATRELHELSGYADQRVDHANAFPGTVVTGTRGCRSGPGTAGAGG